MITRSNLSLSLRFIIVPRVEPQHCVQGLPVGIHTFVYVLAVTKAAPQCNRNWSIIFQIEASKLTLDIFSGLLSMVVRKLIKPGQNLVRWKMEYKRKQNDKARAG